MPVSQEHKRGYLVPFQGYQLRRAFSGRRKERRGGWKTDRPQWFHPNGAFFCLSRFRKGGFTMIDGTRVKPELAATVGQWAYISCGCYVRIPTSGISSVIIYECAACSNTNLRFIHTLEHMKTKKQICVGIECARVLMDDYEIPGAKCIASPDGAPQRLRTS
jgi:hypothetical protein